MREQKEWIDVNTSCGPVRGKSWRNGGMFFGVPYGRAARFRAPEPVSWKDTLDCREYGPSAPQPAHRGVRPSEEEGPFRMNGSEDCLHLNIWSPRIGQGEKLPVVVFVHGGAFQYGSNAVQEFAGDRFMGDEEMVFISPNYRLGVMGFLELGRACGEEWAGSGNCGMRDLLLSLKWVRENCGAFGGDPGRIILMGISAGAKVIGSLLTLPEVQEVCHRVILESGAMQSFRTVETAEAVAERFLAYLPEGTDVRTAPAETVLEAQAEFCACDGSTCFFGPVLEAPFREDWMTQWQRGDHFRGKAVIGCGRHCRYGDPRAKIRADPPGGKVRNRGSTEQGGGRAVRRSGGAGPEDGGGTPGAGTVPEGSLGTGSVGFYVPFLQQCAGREAGGGRK